MSFIKKHHKIIYCMILCFALIVQFLFPFFQIRSSAANTVQSYDDTPIEQDMANMEEAEYPSNVFGECSIVGFMEYCYSENTAYSPYYGLYVYVYNPTEKPLLMREGTNQILMSKAFGTDGTRSEVKNYSLTYLDCTDNHRFYKFKVTESKEQYSIVKKYASLWNGRRRYEITSLDVHFEGETDNQTFGISKIYEFTGYAAWCGEPSLSISTLECQYYGAQDLHLQVHDTNYRFAHKGNNLYDDLQSVYFSLPNEYYEQWGNLTKITAEWYQYKTSPMFVTTDMGAYSNLYNFLNVGINIDGQRLVDGSDYLIKDTNVQTYWRVLWDATLNIDNPSKPCVYFGQGFNARCVKDLSFAPAEVVGLGYHNGYATNFNSVFRINWLFPITKELESIDDYRVSSDEVKGYIQRYANSFPDQEKLLDKYPVNLFERYSDDGYKCNSFEVTDVGSFVDKNSNQSLWEKFWGINETTTFSYSPIVTISEGDLYLPPVDFSEKYYVNVHDVQDIISFARDSYEKNETPVLLRFAKTDYFSSPARFDDANTSDIPDVNGYVAQEYVFLNFDILSLEYTSSDGFSKTVVGVVADSIDIINELTAPEDMPIEDEEWWQQIIALLLICFFVVVFWPLLLPVLLFLVKAFFNVFLLVLKILFGIFCFPFKVFFTKRK